MKLLRQPNSWTCFPTCLANLAQVPLEKVFEIIGHDGSEKINHNLDDPLGRRGFHMIEIVIAGLELGVQLTPVFASIQTQKYHGTEDLIEINYDQTIKRLLERNVAILAGSDLLGAGNHATLWHPFRWGGTVLDPRGLEYSLERFNVEVALICPNPPETFNDKEDL